MKVFPVLASRVDYDTLFHAGHQGVDIFAPRGSEVVAVAAGRVRAATEPKGGLAVYLVEPDGTQYFYGHLDAHVGVFPRSVRAGDVIGLLGSTGSSAGRSPHVHFEIRPLGGAKVDPVPYLDEARGLRGPIPNPVPGAPAQPAQPSYPEPGPAPTPRPAQAPAPLTRVVTKRPESSNDSLTGALGLALLIWGMRG